MLTQSRLKEVLSYDPATGLFTWRVNKRRAVIGATAGAADSRGYIITRIDYRCYAMHRLAWLYMKGEWPRQSIDHVDGNPSNNRFANLRLATTSQNQGNAKRRKNSPYKGVSFHKGKGKWLARIGQKHLGAFESPVEAHAAYRKAAADRFKEFARYE